MDNTTSCCDSLLLTEASDQQGVRINTQSAMKIVSIFIGTIGVVGNMVCLATFTCVRTMFQGNVRLLVLHQCFVDMLAALLLILQTIFDQTYPLLSGLAGQIQCKIWLTKLFLWSTFLASTFNLCCVTLERYFAVVWPLKYRQQRWGKPIYPWLAFIWIFCIVFNTYKIPTTIVVNSKCQVYGNWPSPIAPKLVGVLNLICYFLGPFILLAFCYFKIIKALGSSRIAPAPTGDLIEDKTESNRTRSRRGVIRTLIYMSAMFILCWIWNQTYFLLLNLGVDLDFANPFYHFTVITVISSCSVNPIIYLVQFRALSTIRKSLNRRRNQTYTKSEMTTPGGPSTRKY